MTHILCEVKEGLRPAEATVTVRDYNGRAEYLPVDRQLLTTEKRRTLLPVRVLFQDEQKGAAFVELPSETDSGASRIWVRLADVSSTETVP